MANPARKQFEILDKAVSSRYFELYNRPWIYRQDVDEWQTIYGQLARFAEANSGDSWIRQGWSEEKPRYANAVTALMSKVRVANPANYDTTIKVNGCADCGCNDRTSIPQLSYTPMSIPPSSFSPINPGGNTIFSLGDGVRNLYSPSAIPFLSPSESLPQEIAKDSMTGIIVAIVVGILLWLVHSFTKKRAN